MNKSDESFWLTLWYRGLSLTAVALMPFSWLFRLLSCFRRFQLTCKQQPLPVPVIVVGNITVGGTGKTPLLIALVKHYQSQGLSVGVISRGYGGQCDTFPHVLTPSDDATWVGDEPLLIYRETHCCLAIGPDRVAALWHLYNTCKPDIVISDDGLQHYRLARSIEIAVIDGARGVGNGQCLPSGPLREPVRRLRNVDFVVFNGDDEQQLQTKQLSKLTQKCFRMDLAPQAWYPVADSKAESVPLERFTLDQKACAIAGIGNPQRFFKTLSSLALDVEPVAFSDHQHYTPDSLAFCGDRPLLMTAKDAVKCYGFAKANWWYLSVSANLDPGLLQGLDHKVFDLIDRSPLEGDRSKPSS